MTKCNICGNEHSRPVFEMKGFQLVSCTSCGLVYVVNPPDAAFLEKLYSSAGSNYHTQLRDPASVQYQRIKRISANHLAFVKRIAKSGHLVDVGCSTGQFMALAQHNGFDCAGIEFSRDSADFVVAETGLPVEHGSIHDSQLPAESCELLTMFDVIEHVPDPAADLAKAYELLKPGGWLVLSTPNIDGLFPKASYPLANKLGYWPHPEAPHHLYQFSVKTLGALVEKAGFEVGLVEHCNIDLAYSFGTLSTLIRMPKRLAYAMVFSPLAKLGPLVGAGDWFYMAVRKPALAGSMASAA